MSGGLPWRSSEPLPTICFSDSHGTLDRKAGYPFDRWGNCILGIAGTMQDVCAPKASLWQITDVCPST